MTGVANCQAYGVKSHEEKERAWTDTQGYLLYVQLWIEEAEGGGQDALMLKRFHDRTTRWMTERERAWLKQVIFLTEVNKRTLTTMLEGEEKADEAQQWFESEGSFRDTTGSVFRGREYIRSRLVDYLRKSDPDQEEELELKGAIAMDGKG